MKKSNPEGYPLTGESGKSYKKQRENCPSWLSGRAFFLLTTVLTTQLVFTHFFAIFRKNQGFAADTVFKRKNTPKPPF